MTTTQDHKVPRQRRRFFPAGPAQVAAARLAMDLQADATDLAAVLRVDRSTLYRLGRGARLRSDAADGIAVTLGRHPSELWTDWFGPCDRPGQAG